MMYTQRKQGFTLIELLVVIAIISLLVSILMPALSRAKHLARTAVCMANLRTLHSGAMTYVGEWNVLPQAQNAQLLPGGGYSASAGYDGAAAEVNTFLLQIVNAMGQEIDSHVDIPTSMNCPHFQGVKDNANEICEPRMPDTGWNSTKRGYAMNPYCGTVHNMIVWWNGNYDHGTTKAHYVHPEEVTSAAERNFICDGNECFYYPNWTTRYETSGPENGHYKWWAPDRHSYSTEVELANYTAHDGHVETLDALDGLDAFQP